MFELPGTIYILENTEAQLVKVGTTINNPIDRLLDVNRKWINVKGRCQICLCWRMLPSDRIMPNHVLSGIHCRGSNQSPLEKDTELAELELKNLQESLTGLHRSNKNSAIRRINNLKKVIKAYQKYPRRVGTWEFKASFPTENAYQVESIAHQLLSKYLDKDAPIGEVFSCSVQDAFNAVENALTQIYGSGS